MPILFKRRIWHGLCSCNYAIIEAFAWENDSTQKFKDCRRSPVLQTLIREYVSDRTQIHDVNTSLEKVENIIDLKQKRFKTSSNKKWFDRECRFERQELRQLSNQKHRDPML